MSNNPHYYFISFSYKYSLRDFDGNMTLIYDGLPNDEEIKWAFHIIPLKTDSLQRGIVEPANNQNGGGIEAYFEKGTSNNTILEKTAY